MNLQEIMQAMNRDIFDNSPVETRSHLNEIYRKLSQTDELRTNFCYLRQEMYILGTNESLSPERRQKYTDHCEAIKNSLRQVLGNDDLEYLLRGLANDVDSKPPASLSVEKSPQS